MKILKLFATLLLFIIGITVVLSWLLPAKQELERTVTIQAPAAAVYEQLSKLEHFNTWSVWGRQDSSVKHHLSGTDGTVGASSSWKGDPAISGEGKIEITALEPGKSVTQSILFLSPKKSKANSIFTLAEKNGLTTVTWHFEMLTPRPWNIFNLLSSIDKQLGKDFEEGLNTLKSIVEKSMGTTVKTFEVGTMNFPATSFATIRQQVRWSDISSFFSHHIPILYSEAQKSNAAPGTATGLYYVWDEKSQQTDMAAALPVSAGAKLDNNIIQLVDIPASKAIFVTYHGAYDKLADAHESLDRYMADNKLKPKSPVIEQYISGPVSERDTTKWLTKIVYLVE